MVEEYDMKTHDIITRKIKKPSTFKESKWEYEIGEAIEKSENEPILLKSSNTVQIYKNTADICKKRCFGGISMEDTESTLPY